MEEEDLENGTKFTTQHGGVIIIKKEGMAHAVIDPDASNDHLMNFSSIEAQIEDISTYDWITEVERRELEHFIRRADLEGLVCPKCENSTPREFVLHGEMSLEGKRVQRYECSQCGYLGNLEKFK